MIKIRSLSKSYGSKLVLDGIDLDIPQGRIFGLMGKNGAGKTTLINSIAGRIDYCGDIYIDHKSHSDYLTSSQEEIYYLPVTPHTYAFLTGEEQIQFALELKGKMFHDYKDKVYELLKQFDLFDEKNKLLYKYSYGMKRKISLIAAIILKPKILILDEPVIGLDAPSIMFFKKILREQLAGECTVIFSSHIPDLINNICDSIAIIHQHRVAFLSHEIRQKNINVEDEYLRILGLS